MPAPAAPAAPAEEIRLCGRAADRPGLASFRAAYPGYDDTGALDGLRASEYWYLDAEGQVYGAIRASVSSGARLAGLRAAAPG